MHRTYRLVELIGKETIVTLLDYASITDCVRAQMLLSKKNPECKVVIEPCDHPHFPDAKPSL